MPLVTTDFWNLGNTPKRHRQMTMSLSIDLTTDVRFKPKGFWTLLDVCRIEYFPPQAHLWLPNWEFRVITGPHLLWDKYEKSNWFMEQIIATADLEIGGRKVGFIGHPSTRWSMGYGCCLILKIWCGTETASIQNLSHQCQPWCSISTLTNFPSRCTNLAWPHFAKGASPKVQTQKKNLLQKFFNFLAVNLGLLPAVWFLYIGDRQCLSPWYKCQHLRHSTRNTFILKLSDYVPIINAPTTDKPLQ